MNFETLAILTTIIKSKILKKMGGGNFRHMFAFSNKNFYRRAVHGGGLRGRDRGHHGARGQQQGGAHQGGL